MARTGIERIDRLFAGDDGVKVAAGDPDREAVATVQELLQGHGFRGLPGPRTASRGKFGAATTAAVQGFQHRHELPMTGEVNSETLRSLAETPSTEPAFVRGYVALALDVVFGDMTRLVGLTTQFEGGGKFAAINRGTSDKAGLSFGAIQWAQKPGRLNEILTAFAAADRERFTRTFGGGDREVAQGLLRHTAKSEGGLDATGKTVDPAFDLVNEPWLGRFREAALERDWQRVQVRAAVEAFAKALALIRKFAPPVLSERAVAFLLDVANQHGEGEPEGRGTNGAAGIFRAARRKLRARAPAEADLLRAMAEESVRQVTAQFPGGPEIRSTADRREAFLTTPLLSDQPFAG